MFNSLQGPTGWTNQPGVQIQIVGGLDGIMYLDPANELTMSVTSYFAGAVQALQSAGIEGKTKKKKDYLMFF